ncbi:MAG: cbb3-type cytochrome oxidase assembly protein CcoS [Bacteroidetes bacterium]|nr:MAG: cbb3-type cytochrome oxidase assembly protein CcoS [Bacteroidota bacterium]
MSAIFFLIGFSLVVAVGFLIAFFWAVGSGQYEDAYTPSVRMLWDDQPPRSAQAPEANPSSSGPNTNASSQGDPH